jgi:hypothetical protein
MGVRYIGGAYMAGVPRRDMTDAELATLPDEVQTIVQRSKIYEPCADVDVKEIRVNWRTDEPTCKRVLVVCPTYRLEPETVHRIFALKWGGAIDFYFTRDNPYPATVKRGYANIWHNLTKARSHFLKGNYDAMLIVESDMVPPADALEKLSRIDADVAGGLYMMRHGTPVANAFIHVIAQDAPGTWIPQNELASEWGNVVQTNGVCFGCTLIHRRVVEAIPFTMHEAAAPDWPFMTDCNKQGVVTVCDLSVECGHIRPDGVTIWPDRENGWRLE